MSLKDVLQTALTTGAPAAISVADIMTEGGLTDQDWSVVVDVDMAGAGPFAAANVLSALGASAHETLGAVPTELTKHLPCLSDTFVIDRVSFQLWPSTGQVGAISVEASIPDGKASLAIGDLAITVGSVVLTIGQPLSPDRMVTLIASGAVTSGSGPVDGLRFSLQLPDCVLQLGILPYTPVPVSAVLSAAGLTTTLFDDFEIDELAASIDLLTMVVSLEFAVSSASSSPGGHELDEGSGFHFDTGVLVVTAGLGGNDAGIDARLNVTMDYVPQSAADAIQFDASLEYAGAGSWRLDARATGENQDSGGATTLISIGDLATLFGANGDNLPAALRSAGLDALSVSATMTAGSDTAYTLEAVLDAGTVPVGGGDATGQVQITLNSGSSSTAAAGGYSGGLVFLFDIDGFALVASFQFGQDSETFAVSASYDSFTLTGSFTPGQEVEATLTANAGMGLGDILAEAISLITGDRSVGLSEPFDLLNDITLDAVTLDFKPATDTFSITFGMTGTIVPDLLVVTGVTFSYGGARSPSKGFGISIAYTAGGEPFTLPTFDPTTGSAAVVAQAGLPTLQLLAVVAGQGADIPGQPTDVDDALKAAVALVHPAQAESAPVTLPDFVAGGWVLGAEVLIKQQIYFRFIFNDPTLYGAALTIKAAPGSATGSPYLNALIGLDAEISYHRIDNRNGVYAASLSLPHSANPGASGEISLPLCAVQLPLMSLKAYTDGDYLVDVGFPYNLDFSNSMTIRVEEYIGSGGVYFGRLTGADAPALPDAPPGAVGIVTEVGVGLQIGIYYSENFGPLSGSLSITAQGLFDGVFADITAKGGSHEYYNITAALGISGALQAEINFLIVSASLYIGIDICAEVNAIYKQPVRAHVWASVDVELKASIDLGLFTIHKSFSFSATISESFTLSNGSNALVAPAVSAAGPVQSLAGCFHGCPLEAAVLVWLTPVLTRTDSNTWGYALDFSVPTASQATAAPVHSPLPPAPSPAPFTTLLGLVFGWFAYAYHKAGGALPATVTLDTLTLAPDDLDALEALIGQLTTDPEKGFNGDDLTWLATYSLTTNLAEPSVADGSAAKVATFPLLPGSTWLFDGTVRPYSQEAGQLARDYFVLLAHSVTAYARRQAQLADPAKSINQLIAELDAANPSQVAQVAGMATRLMTHGNRMPGTQVSAWLAAGLQPTIAPGAEEIAFMVAPAAGQAVTMGTNTQPPSGNLYPPAKIATFAKEPVFDEAATTWRIIPPFTASPHIFAAGTVTPIASGAAESAGALWRLPRGLVNQLGGEGPTPGFLTAPLKADTPLDVSSLSPLPAADYAFASVIDITVSRGVAPPKANVYPIHAIGGRGKARLREIVRLILSGSPPDLGPVELCFTRQRTSSGQTAALGVETIDGSSGIHIYVENFSAESIPGAESRAVGSFDPAIALLLALEARALTDQGGFHLAAGALALPDEAFDSDGLARLSVVVSFAADSAGGSTLASYHSAVRAQPGVATDIRLGIWSPALTTTRPAFMPGVVGIELELAPSDVGAPYLATLNELYHLVALAPVITRPGLPPIDLTEHPLITSPMKSGLPRIYRGKVDVFDHSDKQSSPYVRFGDTPVMLPSDPTNAQDPYALVGATVDISASTLVDMFGNGLPLPSAVRAALTPQEIVWIDQIHPLRAWPGLSSRYGVSGGADGPELSVKLEWSPPQAMTPAIKNRLIQRYTDIYFQLERVDASITSSLLDGQLWPADQPLAQQLQNFVRQLIAAIAAGGTHKGKLVLPAPAESAITSRALCPLTTSLVFALKSDVPVGAAPREGFTVASPLYPDQWEADASDDLKSSPGPGSRIRIFAKAFEAAFCDGPYKRDFKLMSGEVDEQGHPTFWLFRYGPAAVNLTFSPPVTGYACAAPRPAATRMVPRPAVSLPFGPPGPGAPSGPMDLDASLRRLLDHLDAYCRPETAIMAEIIERGVLQIAQCGKIGMAYALSSWVLDTMTGEPAAPAAVDAYLQAMLKSLNAFYALDGAVVYDVQARMADAPFTDPIAVYGKPVYAGTEAPLSCSAMSSVFNTGSPDGNTSTAVTFTFADSVPLEQVDMPTLFVLQAVRTDLVQVAAPPAIIVDYFSYSRPNIAFPPYLDGRWLHFIVPPPPIELPARSIGVPLRAQPAAPTPMGQSFTTALASSGPRSLQEMKAWTITGSYRHPWAPQDQIAVLVNANLPPTQALSDGPVFTPDDLILFLAQYEQVWSVYGPDLQRVASGKIDGHSPDAVSFLPILTLLDAMVASVGPPPTPSLPDQATAAFFIKEGINADGAWQVQVRFDPGLSALPTAGQLAVDFTGCVPHAASSTTGWTYTYTTSDGRPLDAAGALKDPLRLIALPDTFDIIGAQNGAVGYATLRNSDFAAPFRYQSAVSTPTKPLYPHVDHTAFFDATAQSTDALSLNDALNAYLVTLLQSNLDGATSALSLQLTLELAFAPIEGTVDVLPMVSTPLAFQTAKMMSINATPEQVQEVVGELVSTVAQWSLGIGVFDPAAPPWNRLYVKIATTVYAEPGAAEATPLLTLRGACLPMARLRTLAV